MTIAMFRATFRLLTRVSPRAASTMAVELFRTPRRHRTPDREREAMRGATPLTIPLGSSTVIRAWIWGEGPTVILVHGWEGRGSQMAAFAAPLVRAGFRVVTFDAPAHGRSSGRQSSLPHFTWALRGVVEAAGRPHALIAHSLGCAATTLALRDGLDVERLVFIAPPLDPSEYTRQFGAIFGLNDSVVLGLRQRVEERFLRPWSDYSLAATAPRMKTPLLIVHDQDDTEVRYGAGATLAELWPGARLMTTNGLGHRRVLRDPEVLREVVEFTAARQVASLR
jgi:pimeloyl-ACP methyl ester carboxylesterase